MINPTIEQLKDKLKRIEEEAEKSGENRKFILRKWWAFYKRELDKLENQNSKV